MKYIPHIFLLIVEIGLLALSFLAGYDKANNEWQIKYDKEQLAAAAKIMEAQQSERVKERIIYRDREVIINAANTQSEIIRNDSNGASDMSDRLRESAEIYTSRCSTDPAITAGGETKGCAMVLSDLLLLANDAAIRLARTADDARNAGAACEAIYQSVVDAQAIPH